MNFVVGVVASAKALSWLGWIKKTYFGKFQTYKKVQRKYNELLMYSLVLIMKFPTQPPYFLISYYCLDLIILSKNISFCV